MRGGERCLEVLCELFPEAPLFTLLDVPGSVPPLIESRRIVTSFVQRLPRAAARYRYYLPAFPLAISRFDLSGYDLVVSMSHCVAKGVRVAPRALHVCYCFSPMRYVWDLYDDYFGPGRGLAARVLVPPVAAALRRWDRRTAGVHRFVAISRHIADRIRRAYDRPADVIPPPVDVQRFEITDTAAAMACTSCGPGRLTTRGPVAEKPSPPPTSRSRSPRWRRGCPNPIGKAQH